MNVPFRVFGPSVIERVLVVDSSKIGTDAAYRMCAVEKCDTVITDKRIRASDLAKLRKLTRVLVAQ